MNKEIVATLDDTCNIKVDMHTYCRDSNSQKVYSDRYVT